MMTSNDTVSYKQRKEDFVSGLSGGEVSEINYVTAIAPVCDQSLSLLSSSPQFRSSFHIASDKC